LAVFGTIVLALGLFGTVRLFQYSGLPDLVSFLITMDRGRYIGDGFGRYMFLSQWVPWGVTLVAIAILGGRWGKSRLISGLILVGSLAVVVVNSYWSGGRATILFGIAPLLMCIVRLKKSRGAGILLFFLALVVAVVVAMTSARSEFRPQISDDIVNIADWHAGRFSMVGLGFALTANSGFGYGTTLLEGLSSVLIDSMSFLHIPLQVPRVQGIASVVGAYLLNDPENSSIPPGSICELYYNFGLLGVIAGHYLIGRLARYCSNAIHSGSRTGTVLLGAYILLNIGISAFSGTLSVSFYYVTYIGLPLIGLYWWESLKAPAGISVQSPQLLAVRRPLASPEGL
jgi:hypothetical protein